MERIDNAEVRSAKKFISAETLLYEDDTMVMEPGDILLDPNDDIPLKLHAISTSEMFKLRDPDWEPPLRLTPEERYAVEREGTTLLLGRSGTG
jgi:hypothetical protein